MSELKEYIVTLKNKDDLEEFYHDMETPDGNLHIPNRTVDLEARRPISRNTHYHLTDEEAEQLRGDSRVEAVTPHPRYIPGLEIVPSFIQSETQNWDKSTSMSNPNHKNWGLYRLVLGSQVSNWGENGSSSTSGTIQVNAEGKNVDVVIVDGHFHPSHPEFARNSDGSGGTRAVSYNWFQHNPTVRGTSAGNYIYTPYIADSSIPVNSRTNYNDNNNHGSHVAGTVAGNRQGWARSANIYNINPFAYPLNPNPSWDIVYLFDYIRAFHNSKPINSATQRRNPTICNNSWGYAVRTNISNIASINYRGATIFAPTASQLFARGVVCSGTTAFMPSRYAPIDADIIDAMNDGIIQVCAAGNDYTKIDLPSGLDYNNWTNVSGQAVYYHRGMTPGAATGAICVGAVSALVNETKAIFSNCGPRISIFSPGDNIMSSVHIFGLAGFPTIADPRNSSYYLSKIDGTSMASPQVCGILACQLEIYPRANQAMMLEHLQYYAKTSQMTDTGGSYTDITSLQGATNRYAFYQKERKDSHAVFPRNNYWLRRTTGSVYPRTRKRQTTPR